MQVIEEKKSNSLLNKPNSRNYFGLRCVGIILRGLKKNSYIKKHSIDPDEFKPDEKFIYNIDTSDAPSEDENKKESLTLLSRIYINHHFWLRNYDTLIITMVSFISAAIVGYIGFFSEDGLGTHQVIGALLLITIGFYSTDFMLKDVNEAWLRVVKLETIFGLYKPLPIFYCAKNIENGAVAETESPLFEMKMRQTGEKIPPLFGFAFLVYVSLFIFTIMSHENFPLFNK